MLGKRRIKRNNFDGEGRKSSDLVNGIRKLDIFRKTKHMAIERSGTGGLVSCIVFAFLFILFGSELLNFISLKRRDTMTVDQTVQEDMNIYFNISFPNVRCSQLHVDVVDASGESQIDVNFNTIKNPVTESGDIIFTGSKDIQNKYIYKKYEPENDPLSPNYCGVCYKKRYNKGRCCNSCDEVINRLKELRVTIPPKREIPQCLKELSSIYPGCNMLGVLKVQKVTGNFHFAPGHSFSYETGSRVAHIHEFDPSTQFDCSHTVHELSFGQPEKNRGDQIITNPLDDREVLVNGTTIHKYFIKVVPTSIRYPFWFFGRDTYQYSYTEHIHHYTESETIQMPGVFFVYDFNPIRITYQYYRIPITHFVVQLCAVCGGILVLSKFLNSFYRETVDNLLRKKFD